MTTMKPLDAAMQRAYGPSHGITLFHRPEVRYAATGEAPPLQAMAKIVAFRLLGPRFNDPVK